MKTISALLAIAASVGLSSINARAQSGGSFTLVSTVIAGGGSQSSSSDARFVLTATAAQREAAPAIAAINDSVTLEPGFWHSIKLVQSVGAPVLKMRAAANGQVVISWPVEVTGFVLEEAPSLPKVNWNTVATPVVNTATEHTVTVPASGPMKYYRLRHQ